MTICGSAFKKDFRDERQVSESEGVEDQQASSVISEYVGLKDNRECHPDPVRLLLPYIADE